MRDDIREIIEDEIERTDWDRFYRSTFEERVKDREDFLELLPEDGSNYDLACSLVDEMIQEDWFDESVEDKKRADWESEQEARDPYGWRGLRRSDFYSI